MITYRSGTEESVNDYVLVREKDRQLVRNVTISNGCSIKGNGQEGEEVCKRRKTWLIRDNEEKK